MDNSYNASNIINKRIQLNLDPATYIIKVIKVAKTAVESGVDEEVVKRDSQYLVTKGNTKHTNAIIAGETVEKIITLHNHPGGNVQLPLGNTKQANSTIPDKADVDDKIINIHSRPSVNEQLPTSFKKQINSAIAGETGLDERIIKYHNHPDGNVKLPLSVTEQTHPGLARETYFDDKSINPQNHSGGNVQLLSSFLNQINSIIAGKTGLGENNLKAGGNTQLSIGDTEKSNSTIAGKTDFDEKIKVHNHPSSNSQSPLSATKRTDSTIRGRTDFDEKITNLHHNHPSVNTQPSVSATKQTSSIIRSITDFDEKIKNLHNHSSSKTQSPITFQNTQSIHKDNQHKSSEVAGIKAPIRSRSADASLSGERNNNKTNLPCWLTRIKCFVGLGKPEECKCIEEKPLSAPACLTAQETHRLVEDAYASLKDRIQQLETKLIDKLNDDSKECSKKKKKYKKPEPYLQFYSKYCARPPKPCIQPGNQLTLDEDEFARCIATRSRSPTPSRKKKRSSKSPQKRRCKCRDKSNEAKCPEPSQVISPCPCVPPCCKINPTCLPPCCESSDTCLPPPPCCMISPPCRPCLPPPPCCNISPTCLPPPPCCKISPPCLPPPPCCNISPTFLPPPPCCRMSPTCLPPPPCCNVCCPPGGYQPGLKSYDNMNTPEKSPKPQAKTSPVKNTCDEPMQVNRKKRGRPGSIGRQEVKAPTPFPPSKRPESKNCPFETQGNYRKPSPQKSPCGTLQTTRICQPFCRPSSNICTTCCGLGNDTNCTFTGLGNSYSRSKSGDAVCKTLLAKYRHPVRDDQPSGLPSGQSMHSQSPFINAEIPLLPVPGINRTNSRKLESPDTYKKSSDPQNSISYSHEPFKDGKPHKEIQLQKVIHTPSVNDIGLQSHIDLFQALKQVEYNTRRKNPHKKYFLKKENRTINPPFTLEVFEEINEKNRLATGMPMSVISEANTNNGALCPDLDNSYIGHLYTRYETLYCQGNSRKKQTLAIKKLNRYLDNVDSHNSSSFDSGPTYNDRSKLSWSCQNNNYGEENNFRFFRQYLNITPAQSDSRHSSPERGDGQSAYGDEKMAINDREEVPSELKGASANTAKDGVDDSISRLDKWILGEFPEEVSSTSCKSKSVKRKTSSYGVFKHGTRNKKAMSRTGQRRASTNVRGGMSTGTTQKRSTAVKPSEPMKNNSPKRLPSADVSPRKMSDTAFSSPEQYISQKNLDDSMSPDTYSYYDIPERGATDMENKKVENLRRNNDKSGKTIAYYPNRMMSPRSPITKSAEMKYTPKDNDDSDDEPDDEETHQSEDFDSFPTGNGESCVDGGGSASSARDSSRASNFLSKLSSIWNSKTKVADSQPDKLFGRESSVDVDIAESSVDMVDDSSNNEYCSLIKPLTHGSRLSNEANTFLSNVDSIQDGKCITGSRFEINSDKNIDISSNEAGDCGVSQLNEYNSMCSLSRDDVIDLDVSTNNGGDTTDDGTSVDESKAEHDKMEIPVTTLPGNGEPSSPIGIPAQSVLSARDASMNLQQLLSGSGVTWSKVSAGDVDVANIRRAKEDFLKRLKAKKAGEQTKAEKDTVADGSSGGLPLDLPVVSLKKHRAAEVEEALAEDAQEENNAAGGIVCSQ